MQQRGKRNHSDSPEKPAKKPKVERKDWRWLLWDSDLAYDKIHPELGAGWLAVLKEACCVRPDRRSNEGEEEREEKEEPLRLYRKRSTYKGKFTSLPFEGIAPITASLLAWCVEQDYEPDADTLKAAAAGGDVEAVKWLRENHQCAWDERTCWEAACEGCRCILGLTIARVP